SSDLSIRRSSSGSTCSDRSHTLVAVEALRLPISEDLSGFLALLRRLQVPCRVSEEAGEQVLRVPGELAEQVRQLYAQYPQGDGTRSEERRVAKASSLVSLVENSRKYILYY